MPKGKGRKPSSRGVSNALTRSKGKRSATATSKLEELSTKSKPASSSNRRNKRATGKGKAR